jgi:hypothetical protein
MVLENKHGSGLGQAQQLLGVKPIYVILIRMEAYTLCSMGNNYYFGKSYMDVFGIITF